MDSVWTETMEHKHAALFPVYILFPELPGLYQCPPDKSKRDTKVIVLLLSSFFQELGIYFQVYFKYMAENINKSISFNWMKLHYKWKMCDLCIDLAHFKYQ